MNGQEYRKVLQETMFDSVYNINVTSLGKACLMEEQIVIS